MIRSKAKVTDGQGHRNSHKMAINHWSWPTLCLNKMLIKLDEPSPVFYHFTSQNMCMIKCYKNKHNAELQRADPGRKVRGNSVLGVVFSHTMPKMDFRYSHRFS